MRERESRRSKDVYLKQENKIKGDKISSNI